MSFKYIEERKSFKIDFDEDSIYKVRKIIDTHPMLSVQVSEKEIHLPFKSISKIFKLCDLVLEENIEFTNRLSQTFSSPFSGRHSKKNTKSSYQSTHQRMQIHKKVENDLEIENINAKIGSLPDTLNEDEISKSVLATVNNQLRDTVTISNKKGFIGRNYKFIKIFWLCLYIGLVCISTFIAIHLFLIYKNSSLNSSLVTNYSLVILLAYICGFLGIKHILCYKPDLDEAEEPSTLNYLLSFDILLTGFLFSFINFIAQDTLTNYIINNTWFNIIACILIFLQFACLILNLKMSRFIIENSCSKNELLEPFLA